MPRATSEPPPAPNEPIASAAAAIARPPAPAAPFREAGSQRRSVDPRTRDGAAAPLELATADSAWCHALRSRGTVFLAARVRSRRVATLR